MRLTDRFDVTTRTGRRFRAIYIPLGSASPNFPSVTATGTTGIRGDLIEVYDLTYDDDPRFTPDGQFVGRYYVDTILNNHNPRIGIDLGPGWSIDASTWDDIIVWVSLIRSRCGTPA